MSRYLTYVGSALATTVRYGRIQHLRRHSFLIADAIQLNVRCIGVEFGRSVHIQEQLSVPYAFSCIVPVINGHSTSEL